MDRPYPLDLLAAARVSATEPRTHRLQRSYSWGMTVTLVALAVLAAACVQSTTGLGFALVLSPVVFALLAPAAAVVIVTALGLVLNLLVLAGERRRPRVAWREVLPILAAVAPGAVGGMVLLRDLPKPALQVGVGVVLLSAVAIGHLRRAPAPSSSVTARLAIGLTTGVLTTSAGVSGPPIALWLSRTELTPSEVRDSLSATFLAIGLIAVLALVPIMHRAHLHAGLLAAGIACVAAGHAVGRRAFSRVEKGRFDTVLRAVIVCAGVASIAAGAAAL
jgi:uncharacterized membrane protein YfcA